MPVGVYAEIDLTRCTDHDRRAKVKCVHEGTPPCRRCQKTKTGDCALTDPRESRSKRRSGAVESAPSRKRKVPHDVSAIAERDQITNQRSPIIVRNAQEDPISSLSASTVISAIETYRKKFPIANFLHYPSLISDVSSNFESVDPVFIASLLSLCVRFMNGDGLEDEETYAAYAQSHLAHRVMEAPSLYLAQSLVMISFYEWGAGRPYQAWMYSGTHGRKAIFHVCRG